MVLEKQNCFKRIKRCCINACILANLHWVWRKKTQMKIKSSFGEAKLARMTKLRDASLRKNGILDKEDGYFLEALREKCEEVFYKTELSKQQSFDDTFIPDGGWEDHFEDIKSNF